MQCIYISFFNDRTDVDDKELFPLIEATLDQDDPRQWYYALMDYGVMLKKKLINPSRRSKHHTRQSKFDGSDRQIRGAVIRLLTTTHTHIEQDLLVDEIMLHPRIEASSERIHRIIEGFWKRAWCTETMQTRSLLARLRPKTSICTSRESGM